MYEFDEPISEIVIEGRILYLSINQLCEEIIEKTDEYNRINNVNLKLKEDLKIRLIS